MASWKKPGRAARIVIYEEDGTLRQYVRSEGEAGGALWREAPVAPGADAKGAALGSDELLAALQSSVNERRRATRGLKFRL